MLNLVGGVSYLAETPGAEEVTATEKKATEMPQPRSAQQDDTVEVSAAAKVQALNKDGQSVTQIASNLGLTVKEVKDYLDITDDLLKAVLAASVAAAAK
jgi:hypothetical protein